MREDVKRDLEASKSDFLDVVWPAIKQWCGKGELVPCEGEVSDRLKTQFDTLAGVDAWQIIDGVGMRGIASRVQPVASGRPWNTYTIRTARPSGAPTEYEKRLDAIKSDRGLLYPALTVQAYVVKTIVDYKTKKTAATLESVAVVKTKDLFLYVEKNRAKYRDRSVHDGSAKFIAIPWADLERDKVDVKIFVADKKAA